MFGEIASSGSGPALEAAMRFAAQRQKLILHNIANVSTPGFIQQDVSVSQFQTSLQQAIDRRRQEGGLGDIALTGNDEVSYSVPPNAPPGTARQMTFEPAHVSGHATTPGILFHDRNNRSLESLMQDLVENATMYRVAADLLRSRADLMRAAISERV